MTTDILCRFDARDQAPVVFLRDTIQGDKIQVWTGQGNPKIMPLDYYKMTSPLSADDERVLMERYKQATGKQDQVIRITHRLPRTSRPMPNMLAAPGTGPVVNAQGENTQRAANAPRRASVGAKPLDTQPLPQGPQGDLPKPGETPAALPADIAQPVVNESASASLFRRIQELNQRSMSLHQKILDLNTEGQKATTDFEATKVAIKELTAEFEKALEAEAAEELRKRREMLAAITQVASDPITTFEQTLQQAGAQPATPTAPVEPLKAEAAPTPPAPAKNGSKPASKPAAKPAGKPAASKSPAPTKRK